MFFLDCIAAGEPCPEGATGCSNDGDCDTDEDCIGDLVCGTNNCPEFGPLHDCCEGNFQNCIKDKMNYARLNIFGMKQRDALEKRTAALQRILA